MNTSWLWKFTAMASLLSVGCASPGIKHTYEGTKLTTNELALVLGIAEPTLQKLNPTREKLSFLSVDDDATVPWYSLESYPTSIYVLPGKHKVEVRYEYRHGAATSPLWVDARSNRTYQVKIMNPESRTERIYFVIEDITAQTLVGGTEKKAKE